MAAAVAHRDHSHTELLLPVPPGAQPLPPPRPVPQLAARGGNGVTPVADTAESDGALSGEEITLLGSLLQRMLTHLRPRDADQTDDDQD